MPDVFTKEDEKAFDFASHVITQIITLSTAVLASSAMIAKEFMQNNQTTLIYLTISWVCFLLSIVSGIWALLQLTTELIKPSGNGSPSIKNPKITSAASFQFVFFIVALSVLVWHVISTWSS